MAKPTAMGKSPRPEEIVKLRKSIFPGTDVFGTKGESQEKLAKLIYSTKSSVVKWENGKAPMPPGLWELANIKGGNIHV